MLETVKIADPYHDPLKSVSVKLLDGTDITVPFTTNFESGHLELKMGSGAFDLDIVLLFPLDDAISNFLNDFPPEFRDKNFVDVNGIKFGRIGNIYLSLHIGYRYVRFHYVAATSGMSRLFLESRSIQNHFLKILSTVGGVAGLIFIETDEFPLLTDPSQKIKIDGENYLVTEEQYWHNGYIDIDRFTDAFLPLLPK